MPPLHRHPPFDPLLFLCKQIAGDYSTDLYLEGENGQTVSLQNVPQDPSTKLVIRKITCEGPKECKVTIRNQAGLVHFIPEGEKYASDNLRIVVTRLDAVRAEISSVEAGQAAIRIEADLYPPGLMV